MRASHYRNDIHTNGEDNFFTESFADLPDSQRTIVVNPIVTYMEQKKTL